MNSPLEEYLEELRRSLLALPAHERLEQLEEVRLHLEGLAEELQSQGKGRPDAEAGAVAQFGAVATVAGRLNGAATRRRWSRLIGITLLYQGIGQLLALPLGGLLTLSQQLFPDALSRPLFLSFTLWQGVLLLLLASGALVSGGLLRRLVPGNTLRPLLLSTGLSWLLVLGSVLQHHSEVGPSVGAALLGLLSFTTAGAWEELPGLLQHRGRQVL